MFHNFQASVPDDSAKTALTKLMTIFTTENGDTGFVVPYKAGHKTQL